MAAYGNNVCYLLLNVLVRNKQRKKAEKNSLTLVYLQKWLLKWRVCTLMCQLSVAIRFHCNDDFLWTCFVSLYPSIKLTYQREEAVMFQNYFKTYHTTIILWPFFLDHPGEPVPEENFWILWCKGRLTEADTPTSWLGATPSGLTSAHLHHHPVRPRGMPKKTWSKVIEKDCQTRQICKKRCYRP